MDFSVCSRTSVLCSCPCFSLQPFSQPFPQSVSNKSSALMVGVCVSLWDSPALDSLQLCMNESPWVADVSHHFLVVESHSTNRCCWLGSHRDFIHGQTFRSRHHRRLSWGCWKQAEFNEQFSLVLNRAREVWQHLTQQDGETSVVAF